MAVKRISLTDALGFGAADTPMDQVNRLNRDIANLQTRLQSQGINTEGETDEPSLLTKIFRTLNVPGAAVRSLIREGVDTEPGVDWRRALNRDTLWRKQTETNDILKTMGVEPENKIARFAANFAGDVLTDPLTYLSGGVISGLKVGVPFGKATQVTAKGLGQVARVVPYLDEGRLTAKTIPDAFTRLFRGKEQVIPGVTQEQVLAQARQVYNLTDEQVSELSRRLAGEEGARRATSSVRAPKPKPIPTVSKLEIGTEVRPQDRRNLGRVVSINPQTGDVTVHFLNRTDGTQATKTFSASTLRDKFGNRVTIDPTKATQPKVTPQRARTKDLLSQILPDLKRQMTPDEKVLVPGPLKPVADFIGPIFSTTYGRDARLAGARRGLDSELRTYAANLTRRVFDISKKYGLTEAEDNLLRRLAEEPAQREAFGVVARYAPAGDMAQLPTEAQEAVMKALPALEGGSVRPQLIQAFNELQEITRGEATLPEVVKGWLKARGAEGSGTEMLADYIKHELAGTEPAQFAAKRLSTVQDPSLLQREQGTIEELNKARKTPFEGRMTVATVARTLKAQYALRSYDWVAQQLKNPDWARALDEYADEIARTMTSGDSAATAEKLKALRGGQKIGDFVVWEGGGKLKELGRHVVTQEMYEALTHVDRFYMNPSDTGITNFLEAFDWATNKWRPLVTLRNPAFHVNNFIGNLWNMYLGGMNPADMPARLRQGYDAIRNVDGALKLEKLGAVSLAELKEYALEAGAIGHQALWDVIGVKGLREQLQNLSGAQRANALKRIGTWYDDQMKQLGVYVEDGSKMAMFIDRLLKLEPVLDVAKVGKEAVLKEMAQRAALDVKKYLFDYGDLTEAERSIFRRLAPFYAWTRKNLPLQVMELLDQPGKFAKLRIAKASMEQTSDEPDAPRPAFLNEAMRLPFQIGPQNSQLFYNPRLPAQDISRIPFIGPGDTGRELAGMVNPLLKLPTELTFNKSLFTNRPIERYEGETVGIVGGGRIPAKAAYTVNSTLGVAGKTGAALQAFAPDAEATDMLRLVRTFLPGLYTFDPQKERVSAAYREVERLRSLLRKFEDESGRQVPTKAQLAGQRR